MILANDFSSGLIRFQKLLAQMAKRVLLDLARAAGACIMEVDDRQVTKVITVQPSFHHWYSLNCVSIMKRYHRR